MVGASRRGRLSTALRPSTADEIVRDSGEIDVHVVSHEGAAVRSLALRRPRRAGRRRLWAWVLAVVIPIGVTLLMLPLRDNLSLSTVLLVFLLGVVASSLVGGLLPAIVTAIAAGLFANYFFVPPVGTFTISEPQNAFAIVAFIVVGAVVATIVDRSVSLAQEAARRRAEANVLASLSVGVLGRGNGVRALLDQACETFGMRSAALFESTPDGRRMSVIEVSGEFPPRSVDEADVAVDAGPGLVMALSGSPLPASDRRMLDAFAAQAAAVLERNRLSDRAADATRLRESDAVRTALLAAVSHDLRTPLAGIKASISTLQEPSITLSDIDRSALLESAADAADRLDSLLSNLLDLSRIQTGAVRPILEAVSLDEVLHQALRGVPDQSVVDETDESLPLLMSDAGLLERAVANLVENAVRHSPADVPVRICAAIVPNGTVQLRIVDRGPGVDDADRQRMFLPFQRLGDAPAGNGVGLGLAVARGLTEAVGATLEAEDTPGGGLTMVMSIPLARTDAERTATEAEGSVG